MAGSRPVAFVSSTIFDFRDLRSALRFWLSELGYDAQLSEYNDFTKPLDQHSYAACLKGVELADYFILLVGSRVGGWVDEASRTSITRAEYRHAYAQFKATGRPKIIALVRSDVWAVREDRKELAKLLQRDEDVQAEVRSDLIARIASYPSRIVNNADATFEFIEELGRNKETSDAAKGGTDFPRGNWIHQFGGFEDVIAVLRSQIKLGSVQQAAVVANLQAELVDVTDALTTREGKLKKVVPLMRYVAPVRSRLGDNPLATIRANGKELAWCSAFISLGSSCSSWITTNAIEEAIRSGAFLEWSSEGNCFVPTVLHRAIVRLRDEIARLRLTEAGLAGAGIKEVAAIWTKDWQARADVEQEFYAHHILGHCAAHDRHENILALAAAIYRGLDGELAACKSVLLWSDTPLGATKRPLYVGAGNHFRLGAWLEDHAEQITKQSADTTTAKPVSDPGLSEPE